MTITLPVWLVYVLGLLLPAALAFGVICWEDSGSSGGFIPAVPIFSLLAVGLACGCYVGLAVAWLL